MTDFIIRFISVRIDEDIKRSDKIKAARRRKAPEQPSEMPYIVEDDESEQEPDEDFLNEESAEE